MSVFGSLRGGRGDVAIDLGTANTVVFVRGEGVVVFEPSVIAIDDGTGEVLAVGAEARQMIGRTPASIRALRPLRHGVIADYEVTEQMVRRFLARAIGRRRLLQPRVMLCVPSGLSGIERDAVEQAAFAAGARAVFLIDEPLAAAIGAELPVAEPVASMIVDVGGGTTEVAVIALGSMVVWQSLRAGGFELDDAIVRHVKSAHGLEIGEEQAEQAKIRAGSAAAVADQAQAQVAGRDLASGQIRRATLSAEEIRQALTPTVGRIVDAVKQTLEETPPELAADITVSGITLAGGGALLRGLGERIQAETQLAVTLVDEPLTCVAIGAGRCLDELAAIAGATSARRNSARTTRSRSRS